MTPRPGRRGPRRVEWYEFAPVPSPEEQKVLLCALETALATEAKSAPASGWSSPQYRDGSSLRPGTRIWTAGEESEAPHQPAFPYPIRRRP